MSKLKATKGKIIRLIIQYNICNIYFREQMAETETDGAMFTKYHLLIFPFILNNFIIIHSEINSY